MLNIEKTVENGKAVVALSGRLDTMTAPEAETLLRAILPELKELTLDLKSLEYISSAGLRVLLFAQKTMSAQGAMTVANANETVREIFDVTGFTDILTLA